jgi:hypothetical protein
MKSGVYLDHKHTCRLVWNVVYKRAPFIIPTIIPTAVAQWLRCCATNRKVAGSIPDGVSRSHYGPGVDSASNRNEYQENFLGVNAAGAYGWQPYKLRVPLSWNLGTLTSWNPLDHSRSVTGLIYLIYTLLISTNNWWAFHTRSRICVPPSGRTQCQFLRTKCYGEAVICRFLGL